MTDLEQRHRTSIETILGRPLTHAELLPANTPEAMSAEHREVVKALAVTQHVLSVLYVEAIANVSVAGATQFIDQLTHVGFPSRSAPWGREPGMGRWIFALPAGKSVRTYADVLVANLRSLGLVRALELETNDTRFSITAAKMELATLPETLDPHGLVRLILDLRIIDTEGNDSAVEGAGAVELRLDPDTGGLVLTFTVDIDIYASATWQFRDNDVLARLNASRLAEFLSHLKEQLHARYIGSDGRLETTESGFR